VVRRRGTQPPQRVVLTDPKALRALAHPARTAVIDELYMGNVRTASELADLTGLTPSAMSYHLRALEKWGIICRAEATGDARERPWQRSAATLSWEGDTATRSTGDTVIGLYLDRLRRDLAAFSATSQAMPKDWQEAAVISRGFPWLTPHEVAAATTAVQHAIEQAKGRTAHDHPPGARPVAYFWAVTPLPDEAGTSAGSADA